MPVDMEATSTASMVDEEDQPWQYQPSDAIATQYIIRSDGNKKFRCIYRTCSGEFTQKRNGYRHVRKKHAELYGPSTDSARDNDAAANCDNDYLSIQEDEDDCATERGNVDNHAPADSSAEYDTVLTSYLRRVHASDKDAEMLVKLLQLPKPANYDFSTARLLSGSCHRVETKVYCASCQSEVVENGQCHCVDLEKR